MTRAKPRHAGGSEIDPVVWRFLCDASTADDEENHKWDLIGLRHDLEHLVLPPLNRSVLELWKAYEREILAWWAKAKPGTRPRSWWKYSAPEPRRRVGGTGTTLSAARGWKTQISEFGLPYSDDWLTTNEFPKCPPVDSSDPPTFESEAEYLTRLKLLAPGEGKRLRPDAFDPVKTYER